MKTKILPRRNNIDEPKDPNRIPGQNPKANDSVSMDQNHDESRRNRFGKSDNEWSRSPKGEAL